MSSKRSRGPVVLGVFNLVFALLGIYASAALRDIFKEEAHVDHGLAVLVATVGAAISALLVIGAVGLWRRRSWVVWTSLAWITLVIVAQAYLVVKGDNLDGGLDLLAHAYPVVTVYAVISAITVPRWGRDGVFARPPRNLAMAASSSLPS